MMTIDEIITILQAYKEGKSIQFKLKECDDMSKWIDMPTPCWSFEKFDYRVKPEPTRLEIANKFWKDTFGFEGFNEDDCPCPCLLSTCIDCPIGECSKTSEWWNVPCTKKVEKENNNDDNIQNDERAKSFEDVYSIIISDIGDKEKVLKIQELVFEKKGITNCESERI